MKSGKNTSSAILIERKQANGNIRLIVQLYAGGTKVQESTGIIIKPNDSRREKIEKRELAEKYRKKREEELKTVVLGVKLPENHLDDSFFEYFDNVASEYNSSTRFIFRSARRFLLEYSDENTTFRHITKEWLRGFRDYLLHAKAHYSRIANGKRVIMTISHNTAANIYSRVVMVLKRAAYDEIIPYSPTIGVKGIPIIETLRSYLNEEELQKLIDTKCPSESTRRAFFFSCFTGFRFSDISRLTFDNIRKTENGYSVSIKMKKTSLPIYQDISDQAASFIEFRPSGKVFPELNGNPCVNDHLRKWARDAGIAKKVTFHVARHTFATLLLKHKTDIYTVSKLLGHTKVTTTQIYAKITDEAKRDAVNSLNGIITTQKTVN